MSSSNPTSVGDERVIVGHRAYSRHSYAWILTGVSLVGYMFTTFDPIVFGASLPVLAKSFHMTTSGISLLVASIFFVGAVSGFVMGPLADHWGRKPVLQLILLTTGIFSGLTAFVSSIAMLTTVRIFSSLGINATSPANTLISEEAPPRIRGLLMGIVQAGFPLGSAIAGTLAAVLLPNWRPLFLIAFAPVLMVFIVLFFIRESPRFREVQRERKEGIHDNKEIHTNLAMVKKNAVAQILAPDLRRQTFIVNIFNFLAPAGVIVVATFLTLYVVTVQHFTITQAATLLAINNWVALVAQLIVGYLSDKMPPKWLLVIGAIVGSLGMILLLNPHAAFSTDILAMVIYGMFGNGVYGTIFRYTGESYPTRVRATGMFFAQADVDLMFVLLPLLASAMFLIGKPQVILYIATAAQIVAGLTMIAGKNIKPQAALEEVTQEI